MADGDKVLRDWVAVTYVDDFGNSHAFKTLKFYKDQAALGWDLLTNHSLETMSKGWKPRTWLVCDPDHPARRARIPVASNADYLAGQMDVTTIKVCWYGQEYTMTLYGKEGERHRGKVLDVEAQAVVLPEA